MNKIKLKKNIIKEKVNCGVFKPIMDKKAARKS